MRDILYQNSISIGFANQRYSLELILLILYLRERELRERDSYRVKYNL